MLYRCYLIKGFTYKRGSRCTSQIITQLTVAQPGILSDDVEVLLPGAEVGGICVVVVAVVVVDACETYTDK